VIVEPRFAEAPAFRPAAEDTDVAAAVELLNRAERPVIVAGGGVAISGAQAALLALAERLGIPFVTSLNGKSGFVDDHPLNVGVVGTYSRSCANTLVLEADLVFFVGSHTGGQVTANWRVPPLTTPVIQLDIEPQELGRNYPNVASLLGDARTVLQQLEAAAGRSAGPTSRSAWLQRARDLVAEYHDNLEKVASADAMPMRPDYLCRELSDVLPEDAIVVVDTGHAGMWTAQALELRAPTQTYLRAAGSLGWALPAALGAKCAAPDRPVLCFTGDGGFYYHLAELETAARYGINAVILVNNNFSLSQDKRPFNAAYGGQQHEGFEMWQFSRQADLAQLAESLGCLGIRVERPTELKPALAQAFGANRPVLLDVRTDIDVAAPRAWLGAPDIPLRPGAGY
jgi:acetolactate synthase-1/2/3 large subunit